MKSLKAKLMTSVVMLLVAAIALSTASYAWFTISTNPEVKDLKAQVSANENLEIAYARDLKTLPNNYGSSSGKAGDWGNLIDTTYTTTDDYKVDYDALDKTLRPVFLGDGEEKVYLLGTEVKAADRAADTYYMVVDGKTYPTTLVETTSVKGTFYYPVYEYTIAKNYGIAGKTAEIQTKSDGRICYYEELVEVPCQIENPKFDSEKAESVDNPKYIDIGVGYIMQQTGSTAPTAKYNSTDKKYDITGGVVYGYYVDYWVRSNLDGILRLSDAANRSGQDLLDEDEVDADGKDGEGSWFKTNKLTEVTKPTDPGSGATQEVKDKYNADVLAYETYIENQRKALQFASAIRIALKDVTEEIEEDDPLSTSTPKTKYAVTDPVVLDDAATKDVDESDKYSVANRIGRKVVDGEEQGIIKKTIPNAADAEAPGETLFQVNFNENQNLVELEANLAKTLRFYVYLNGGSVKNETASNGGFTNAGELNLQFRLVATGTTDGDAADEVVANPMPIVDDVESAES